MYKIMAGSLTIYDSSDKNTYPVSKPSFEEGLNEAGTLTFTIFPGHPNYNSITRMRTFVTAYRDTREIFYGRVLITDKGLDGRMEVTCEGGLTFFLDTEMGKGQWDETITAFLQRVINNHNSQVEADKRFTLGTVNVPKYNQVQQWDITSYTVTKNVLETMVAGRFGGFFRVRPNPNGYHYLDYLENFGRTNTQRIRIGENIIDKDDHVSGENLFTVLRPIGRAEPTGSGNQDLDLTIGSLSQSDVTLPNVTKDGEFLRLTDKIQLYGSIVRTEQFNNATTAIQVLRKAEEFITRRGTLLPANCKINYVDLNHLNKQLGEVLLGDMFNDIEGYSGITMTVSNVNWDMEDPANDAITFQNQEELNANRMDTNVRNSTGGTGGSSSSSLSSSMSKSRSQDAFRYKYIKEQGDDLILFGKRTLLQAEQLESLNNKIFLTVREKDGVPGEFIIKAERHTDDPNGAELIMNVDGFKFKKKSGYDTDGETILEDYATTTALSITDGRITSEVTRATTAEGEMSSRITQTADQIALKVSKGNVATQLSVECGNVTISGGNLVVSGYITSQGLITTLGSFTGPIVTTDYLAAPSIHLNGDTLSSKGMSFIGNLWMVTADEPINLAHSHAISMSEASGVVTATIGAAQAADGTATFNIADTQFYKDAVRSARSEGVQSVRILADDITLNGNPTYYSSSKQYSVPVYAEATNGASNTNGLMIDASDAWNAGKNGVTLSDTGWTQSATRTITASNGQSVTVSVPNVTLTGGSWSRGEKTVSAYYGNSGVLGSLQVELPSSATWSITYNAGGETVQCTIGGKTYTHTFNN